MAGRNATSWSELFLAVAEQAAAASAIVDEARNAVLDGSDPGTVQSEGAAP